MCAQVRDVAHIKLSFNDMIMTVSEQSEHCHPQARFWFPLQNSDKLQAYCKVTKQAKVACKEHFGKLVACGIIKVRT